MNPTLQAWCAAAVSAALMVVGWGQVLLTLGFDAHLVWGVAAAIVAALGAWRSERGLPRVINGALVLAGVLSAWLLYRQAHAHYPFG